MKKVTVWYSIQNNGDGSAGLLWFESEADAQEDQDNLYEGWGESCLGSVETFEGSDIHKRSKKDKKEKEEWNL